MKIETRRVIARIRVVAAAWLAPIFSPGAVAITMFLVASALCCAGVFLLFGRGCALLAAAGNVYLMAFALARAVYRG